jgi:hypothetical protein
MEDIETQTCGNKTWWNFDKGTFGQGAKTTQLPVILDDRNEPLTGNYDKAEYLNAYITSITHLVGTDKIPHKDQLENIMKLSVIHIEEYDVLEQFNMLNISKCNGPDGITARLMKAVGGTIAPSLTKILNLSLQSSNVS